VDPPDPTTLIYPLNFNLRQTVLPAPAMVFGNFLYFAGHRSEIQEVEAQVDFGEAPFAKKTKNCVLIPYSLRQKNTSFIALRAAGIPHTLGCHILSATLQV